MKQVILDVVDNYECQEALRGSRLGRFFNLDPTALCAGGGYQEVNLLFFSCDSFDAFLLPRETKQCSFLGDNFDLFILVPPAIFHGV